MFIIHKAICSFAKTKQTKITVQLVSQVIQSHFKINTKNNPSVYCKVFHSIKSIIQSRSIVTVSSYFLVCYIITAYFNNRIVMQHKHLPVKTNCEWTVAAPSRSIANTNFIVACPA